MPLEASTILVRKASPSDAMAIAAFQIAMALETEGIILDQTITSKGVQAVFEDDTKGTYYIAETDGKSVASILTTPEWSDWRNQTILWMQSVYVMPGYRDKGVFKAIYSNLFKIVESDTAIGGIRLYVDKTNTRAQEVYTRLGMNGEHYKVFEWMK